MDYIIRDIEDSDLGAVLNLNQSEVPHVGSIDLQKLQWFAANATYFRVACMADQIAAFLVGFGPGTSYDSPNYRWFCDRYADFAYVDRIAVADFARRGGLASCLYDDFAATLPESVRSMTCEVNIRPPNESSMRFHERLGFHAVGSQTTEGDTKEVALLAKSLGQDRSVVSVRR
jgi:predicted GNAT superfamily acetyltransferase